MQDVKIIDIDNEQWNIKDQEARNRIAALETKTTIKVTKKIDEEKLKMNLVEINGEKFIQLHFEGFDWSGNIGEIIASFNQDFGLTNVIRCVTGMDFVDGTGRAVANIDINPTGSLKIWPQIQGQVVGTFKACKLYGDSFIRVTF